ncbi:hypothetical protein DSO57_1033419 [Entomophthora muscae]|uniref:Uncharacterized protein n=1 Tax=Entomophthora muscae TaxID=34485 RepID=A0ACC2TYR4_9FUNG|nr:hypothetical protein DSO57_1033419 [Entomophthora muscae]
MTDRGRVFIGGEFARLLQDWYRTTEGLAPAEVQVYGGDTCLVIGKVLEEFALMQAKYKLLINHSPLLENDNFSKLVPGYDPGQTLGTGDQEPHSFHPTSSPKIPPVACTCRSQQILDRIMSGLLVDWTPYAPSAKIPDGFFLYQNMMIPLPRFNALSAQGFLQAPSAMP